MRWLPLVWSWIGWLLATSLLALPVQVEWVELDDAAATARSVEGQLLIEVAGEPFVSRQVALPGETRVDLPARTTARLSLEAEGLWAPERVILPMEGQENVVRIPFWPAGVLEGQLTVPRGHSLPKRLDIVFQPTGSDEEAVWTQAEMEGEVRQSCGLDGEGSFRCRLPALALDFHLHAPGFVPRYFWNVAVEAHTERMGTLALRPGASVVGRVETSEGLPPAAGAMVVLEPATSTPRQHARSEAKLDRRGRRALVDRRGFFQLSDIAPGSYRVRVEKSGYAPAEAGPFTVYDGRETILPQPLALHPPVEFELVLEPPMDPYGRPWRVELRPEGSHEPAEYDVPATGRWTQGGLAPGVYRLRVRSGAGRYEHSWWTERVEIEPHMSPYRIDLPVLQVEGRVTLGDEPLEAQVVFSNPRGGRIRIDTGEDGIYAGYLPEGGLWGLSVESEETGARHLEPVDVEKSPGARAARVDLHVPDTRIFGEVVDTDDRPVPAARVDAVHLESSGLDTTRTDSEGAFKLRGLPEGAVSLSAREPRTGKSSTLVQVTLQEDLEPPSVRLVLESHQEVSGRVSWQGRAVPGAQVSLSPQLPPGSGALASLAEVTTDAEGRFSAHLPARALGASITVLPPGFAAEILSVPLPRKDPLEIEVAQEGGTLALLAPAHGSTLPGQPRAALLLEHDGARITVGSLAPWARFHGVEPTPGRTVLPMMAPGEYVYCLPRMDEPPRCASGFLPLGGELTLRVDEPGDRTAEPRPFAPTPHPS